MRAYVYLQYFSLSINGTLLTDPPLPLYFERVHSPYTTMAFQFMLQNQVYYLNLFIFIYF